MSSGSRLIRGLLLRCGLALCLAPLPALASDQTATCAVADDGGLDAPTVRALHALACSQLRRRGLDVVDPGPGERRFALRIGGRLGAKIPLSFEEDSPGSGRAHVLFSASMTAARIEDGDLVVARLVDAVLDRRSPEASATMDTVTEQEARKLNKRPGERFFIVGLPLPLFFAGGSLGGFSLAYAYELEQFRVELIGQVASQHGIGAGFFGLTGDFIPFATEVSPYLGGGVGFMSNSSSGVGLKLEAGMEALRLHAVRLMVGVDVLVPLLKSGGARDAYPMLHLRLGF